MFISHLLFKHDVILLIKIVLTSPILIEKGKLVRKFYMKLLQKNNGDVLIVVPEFTELDIQNSNQFKTEMSKFLDQGKLKILVNLKNIIYIDSSGLGSIVSLMKKTLQLDGEFKLCELTQDVESAFSTTQLDKIFDIRATEKKGIMSFLN